MEYQYIKTLYDSIVRCDAVYIEDPAKATERFTELGCKVYGHMQDDLHQAIAHVAPDGVNTLTISGTRFTDGTIAQKLGDLFEDAQIILPRNLGGGMLVADGAYQRTTVMMLAMHMDSKPWRIEGHSLGGWTALLAPLHFDPNDVHSIIAWEPPKAANDAFYIEYAEYFAKATVIIHEFDPWAAWPWVSESLKHPFLISWLRNGVFDIINRDLWPGGRTSFSDHNSDVVRLRPFLILLPQRTL